MQVEGGNHYSILGPWDCIKNSYIILLGGSVHSFETSKLRPELTVKVSQPIAGVRLLPFEGQAAQLNCKQLHVQGSCCSLLTAWTDQCQVKIKTAESCGSTATCKADMKPFLISPKVLVYLLYHWGHVQRKSFKAVFPLQPSASRPV